MMSMEVANMILEQLGGNKFIAMTGAKNLCGADQYLQFHISPRNKSKAKFVKIELNGNDTYDMSFMKMKRDYSIVTVDQKQGVYADQLQELFTNVTGLDTSL